MENSRDPNDEAVGIFRPAKLDPLGLNTRCVVCGQATAELDIDWGDAAADPAFYYLHAEAAQPN